MISVLLAFAIFSYAGDGDQTTFTASSGYAGGKICDPKNPDMEGGDESKSGKRPSQHTVEKPGDGWAMAAVAPTLWSKLKGCESTVTINKRPIHIKVMDVCPICQRSGKIDINHSECSQMDSTNMKGPITITWSNCNVNSRGKHGDVRTRN